jgi:HSP20 family molecular chaperone IbpA
MFHASMARQRVAAGRRKADAMKDDFPDRWMWSEACEMLARAERLHRQLFQPVRSLSHPPAWEPPADVLETEREVLVIVALPGVNADRVEAAIEGNELVLGGKRTFPAELGTAVIHRLELPQGRFERRLRLPAGRYIDIRRSFMDGCLVVVLKKAEPSRG